MKHKVLYTITVIAMGLSLLTFWAGLVAVILSACSVIQIALWKIILAWVAVLAVMIVITKGLYAAAEAEEEKLYKKN